MEWDLLRRQRSEKKARRRRITASAAAACFSTLLLLLLLLSTSATVIVAATRTIRTRAAFATLRGPSNHPLQSVIHDGTMMRARNNHANHHQSSMIIPTTTRRRTRFYAKKEKNSKQQHNAKVPYSLGGTPYLKTRFNKEQHISDEKQHDPQTMSRTTTPVNGSTASSSSDYISSKNLVDQHTGNATTTTISGVEESSNHSSSSSATSTSVLEHLVVSPDNLKNTTKSPPNKTLEAPKLLTKPTPTKKDDTSPWNFDFPLEYYYNITKFNASSYRSKIKPVDEEEFTTTTPLLPGKKPNDVVTVADLESILKQNGYVIQRQGAADSVDFSTKAYPPSTTQQVSKTADKKQMQTSTTATSKTKTGKSSSVAFPQSSVLSYRDVTVGSTISGSAFGLILGITIYPNLWLFGMLLGGSFGYDVAHKFHDSQKDPQHFVPRTILSMGRRLAKLCLKIYDFFKGIWFMYKTGQLSYEYYKTYASLDDRFQIQSKLDAWNARFQQGKIAFDKWERDNEVGRKALATLRTFWLVQEDSFKKERRRYTTSRYRIVQYAYGIVGWFRQLIVAIYKAVTGGGSSDLQDFFKGLRMNLISTDWGPRIGAAAAALCACYCVGVLFAVAPMVLGIVAITTGVLFPTWIPSALDSISELVDETRARGRGEDVTAVTTSTTSGKKTARTTKKEKSAPFDRSRYHYFVRQDGSKRWYRTGQPLPLFDRRPVQPQRRGLLGFFKGSSEASATTIKKQKSTAKSDEDEKWSWWNFDF